ncbi:MAG: 6-phospho-beta-glucosidase [Oscillospiraceae bacterium]|nr:6-phospho-beta-glucosidase [Oscillospiraceae bacterium]
MPKLKAAVIGAGSTYTPELIEGFINFKETLPFSEFSLMDTDPKRLDIVGNLAKRQLNMGGNNCTVTLTDSLDQTLDGADFVFGQIRVGKMQARILDEKIPLKYGYVGQETTGAGGFMKALRTIPVMMDIAERMKRLSETGAWLINFTNPSGIIAEALLNYTDINMLGLCNCPINMLKDINNTRDYEYIGLNHLSWITSQEPYHASYYLEYYENHAEKLQNCINAEKTRGEVCLEIEDKLFKQFADKELCVKPPELMERGGAMYSTAAVSAVASIYNDKGEIHVINTKNKGAVPFMDDDDVVEIKCRLGKNFVTPQPVSKYNDSIINLMKQVKKYEKLTVQAAIEGSRDKALAALIANPLIDNPEKAALLLNELLEANRKYIPKFFGGVK